MYPQITWSRLFCLLLIVYALVICLTVTDYGITSDEPGHVAYGEAILKWYGSGFQNPAVFESKNTHLYGGLFDTTVALISHLLPLSAYTTRHLCNAFVGLLGLLAAYRLGNLFAGPRAGFLAALFLLFMPRYYGHAFNNPKDIPFAVAYLWSLYYLTFCIKTYPQISFPNILKTGLSIGAALSIRVGGILLIAYLGLFFLIAFLQQQNRAMQTAFQTTKQIALISAIVYVTTILFWPYLQIHPISGIYQALKTFSNFPEIHDTFFESKYIGSNEIPWHYAPKWLFLTLPEHIFWGLLLSGLLFCLKRPFSVPYLILFFSIVFPLVYAITTQMPLYDGMRHLLFILPPMAVLSALGVEAISRRSEKIHRPIYAITIVLLLNAFYHLIVLHPNQYVYFNRLFAGGLARAALSYDTDYWENSYKQGLHWLATHTETQNRLVTINSPYLHTRLMMPSEGLAWTDLPENADYYLSNTRYDRHKFIPGKITHTIQAQGTNLLYIIQPDTHHNSDPFFFHAPYKYVQLGEFYASRKEYPKAIAAYTLAIQQGIDTLVTPTRMANFYHTLTTIYVQNSNPDKALQTFQKAIAHTPAEIETHLKFIQTLENSGYKKEAIRAYQYLLKIAPDNPLARKKLTELNK